jgi:hypothetical protein
VYLFKGQCIWMKDRVFVRIVYFDEGSCICLSGSVFVIFLSPRDESMIALATDSGQQSESDAGRVAAFQQYG